MATCPSFTLRMKEVRILKFSKWCRIVYDVYGLEVLDTFFASKNEKILFSARFKETKRKWNKSVDEEKLLMIGEYGRVYVFNAGGKVGNTMHKNQL